MEKEEEGSELESELELGIPFRIATAIYFHLEIP
jgi:hypothetical protein